MTRFRKLDLLIILAIFVSGICSSQSGELRILPLGNSLTYGWYDGTYTDGNRIGYRYELYNLLNSAGYDFDFVGHAYTGYSVFSDAENGGIPGIKDEQLASVMANGYYYNKYYQKIDVISPNQPYLNVYPADIILLHIGTNDFINNEIYDYQIAELNNLFDAVNAYETSHSTEVLVIVARIINTINYLGDHCDGPLTNWKVNYYNDELEALVNTRITAGDKIKLIDMQCGADIDYEYDMLNDYHPKQIGYNKMAQHWFDEIDIINAAPVVSPITVTPANEGESFNPISLDSYVTDDYTTDPNIDWTVSPEPVYYNVTISAQRVATVTPKNPDWYGSEVITFIATDDGKYIEKLKKSTPVNVTFNTLETNDPPVIISQLTSFNLNEDTPFDLVLNDLEIEDDNDPSDWTLNILPGANYSFDGCTITPAQDYDEQLQVTVTVSDDIQDSEEFIVTTNYNPVNDAPVITGGGPLETDEDDSIEISIGDLEYYEPDNTPEELTLYVLTGDNYSVNENYVCPASDYNGELEVNVRLQDLSLYSDPYTLHINVAAKNDLPVITSEPLTSSPDNEMYVYAIDAYDVDEDDLTYVAPTKPSWLTIDPTTGVLSGTPASGSVGTHYVVVGANDGTETTYQDYYLEITHLNNPPYFTQDADTTADLNVPYTWRAQASDNDGDDVDFIPVTIPYFLTFLSESGYLTGTPSSENEGIHDVKIGATDGIDTTIMNYLLYVGNPNAIPEPVSYNSESLILYPNPASSLVTITMTNEHEVQAIRIVDMMGQTVYIMTDILLYQNNHSINISGIPAGTYMIIVHLSDAVISKKLLINKSFK